MRLLGVWTKEMNSTIDEFGLATARVMFVESDDETELAVVLSFRDGFAVPPEKAKNLKLKSVAEEILDVYADMKREWRASTVEVFDF